MGPKRRDGNVNENEDVYGFALAVYDGVIRNGGGGILTGGARFWFTHRRIDRA